MRVSLVICFALFIVVVNCATQKTTLRRVVVNAGRGTTKAAKPKSAYAYLRAVRGKKSCVGGTCPFWERHGRSFASLRCYSQQYQECTCLHRMCFSSCMFEREVCNKEMVSCLQQICPRCMPVTSTAMCAVYDSMAERVAQALSVFACYPCCPNLINPPTNNTNAQGGGVMMMTTTPMQSVNVGNTINVAASAAGSVNSMTTMSQNAGNAVNNGANQINGGSPSTANGSTNNFGGVFPGSGMMSSNNNIRNNSNSNSNNNAGQSQQIRQITRPTTRSTTRRVVTTRRTSAANTSRKPVTTTRRASNTTRRVMTTVGGNIIKITTRKPVQAPKKPQTNN